MQGKWSRREVLAMGTGAAAAAAWGGPGAQGQGQGSFVWFSDTHVGITRGYDENLAMLRQIRQTLRPDFAVNGGDVTDYGWPEEYSRYSDLRSRVPFAIHHIPGNHDVRWSPLGMTIYRKELGPPFRRLDWRGVTLFLLDSTVPLSHWGSLSQEQLDGLEKELAALGREAPVILGMHHWPGRDRAMIDKEMALARVIEPYNVKLILTGHGHSDLLWDWEGVACTMCKGLYQGSWQVQTLEAGTLLVTRATGATGDLKEVARIPLASDPAKQKVTPVLLATARPGQPVPGLGSPSAVSWERDKWLEGPQAQSAPKAPGSHPILARGAAWKRGIVTVEDDGPLRPLWQTPLGAGVISQVKAAPGSFLISTLGGTVLRLDAKSGRILWRTRLGGYCHSSPVLSGSRVWIGSSDESLYSLDFGSGRVLSKSPTSGPVYSSPAVAKGIVAVGSGDGFFYGFHEADGSPAWKVRLGEERHAFVQSPVAADGERFFAGSWNNALYAVEATRGDVAWKGDCCADMSFLFSPAIGGPLVAKGSVVVPANGNRLYCFDSVTGKEKWVTPSPGDKFGYSGARAHGDLAVIGCLGDKGEFRALSLSSGEIIWTCATGQSIYDSTPCLFEGKAAILSTGGLLSIASLESGELQAQRRLPPGLATSSPAWESGVLCAATNNGQATAFTWRSP